MTRTAVFDLDGTLVDSAPDLQAALNRLMAARGLTRFTRGEVIGMIGDGTKVLVERALAARGQPFDQTAFDAFMTDYTAHAAVETRPYPGIPEALEALAAAGWRLVVCTNKPEAAARTLLEELGLAQRFTAIGGGDSFPVRKPDPRHLVETLRAADGDPARAALVGDHHNDIAAAKGAGIGCIFATWGYGPLGVVDGAVLARRPADLPALLDGLAL